MEQSIKNKAGLASAAISILLIISFFLPLIDVAFLSLSSFKIFSKIAESKSEVAWMGTVFYIYFGLVIINLLVQIAKGSKSFSSFVGITGLGLLIGFIMKFSSDKDELGRFGELIDFTDLVGVGFYIMAASMIALIVIPGFFGNKEDDEFEELIKEAERLSEYKPSSSRTPLRDDTQEPKKERVQKKPKDSYDRNTDSQQSEIDALKAKIAKLERDRLEREIYELKKQVDNLSSKTNSQNRYGTPPKHRLESDEDVTIIDIKDDETVVIDDNKDRYAN